MSAVFRLALVLMVIAIDPGAATADVGQCHVVDVKFTPQQRASSGANDRVEPPQIVVWVEKPDGTYIDTVFMTAETGRFGLGNRPGRWDFNSGPMFPYGRRLNTFPVWAHRKLDPKNPTKVLEFPSVVFQNCCGTPAFVTDDPDYCFTVVNDPTKPQGEDRQHSDCAENNLSHPFNHSSRENYFCQPYMPSDPKWVQADAMTCATIAFTDKGKLSMTAQSLYPPRTDLVRSTPDTPSVELYKAMNPFDAISAATPPFGMAAHVSWPIPNAQPIGDYVMWLEVSQAFDHNATYSTTVYPAPPAAGPMGIAWSSYGLPYRGQPSIVYKVPFTISMTVTTASTMTYAGYGDPEGLDGELRPPDATITSDTPGSGGSRLQLISNDGELYRALVTSRPEFDYAIPGPPDLLQAISVGPTRASLRFVAPGDDGQIGNVTGYEVRYLANREMTEDSFAEGTAAVATIVPTEPGLLQTIELVGLLPETDYWVGIRAYDDCRNVSETKIIKLTTADRLVGEVDACFVATAAYGSRMANDVELLRHFRDSLMKRSVFGELAIQTYYTFGPAVAGVVGESDLLRATARDLLQPLIAWVRPLSY